MRDRRRGAAAGVQRALRVAVVIRPSVMSDGNERVPTGGELTLIEGVDRVWSDFPLLCRSSPVGGVRRDLIGAWQRP
jgi:hypothetical protein